VLTLLLYGLLAVLLAGVLFLAAAYLLPAGEQIAAPIRDEPIWELPTEKRLDSGDVGTVRLPVALRGYRFAETDLLLDRLADELRSRDEEIAQLRARDVAYGSYESAADGSSSDEAVPPPHGGGGDVDDDREEGRSSAREPRRLTGPEDHSAR
jgi:hypothetical protein